jgi:hypothetical protein
MKFYVTGGSDLAGIEDNSVDALWSFDVFVHINQREFEGYIHDFIRVMRPGAVGVIHHGRSGGKRGGWQSDLSAESVVQTLTDNRFEIVQQFESCKEGGSDIPVSLYQDVVTVFRRQPSTDR